MKSEEKPNELKKYKKPLLVMYVDTSVDRTDSFDVTQTFAQAEAKYIYEYLRFRGCKPVYTSLTSIPGVIRVSIGCGRNTESVIIDELNRLAVDRYWKIRNFLEDFNHEDGRANDKDQNSSK